jgi:prepilin-type N-terminal cleavage/methylation domain-containing protein
MKKEKGFTLVELLAVIVILAIILAIAIPSITGMIKKVTRDSFGSDAKMLLKAVNYKKLQEDSFNPTLVNKSTLSSLLGLSDSNYSSLTIVMDGTDPVISIIGTGKWDGLMACGSYKSMKVVEEASDCSDDTVKPVITLNGSSTVSINLNQTYTDAGATATDNIEGNVTSKITKTGTVTTNTPGTYSVTYSVTDVAGNTTTSVRRVTVVDNVAPTVAFGTNGNTSWAKNRSTTATLSDVSGLNTGSLEYQWTTSTTAPTEASFTTTFTSGGTLSSPSGVTGTYYLWILGKDSKGNTAIVRSNVFNLDNALPTVAFGTNGNSTWAKTYSSTSTIADANSGVLASSLEYQWTTSTTAPTEASFTTTFTSGGTLSSPSGATGTYYLWILAKDNAGNTTITRSNVFNIDNTKPVITLTGSSTVTVALNGTYTDAGATATDANSGVNGSVVKTGTVNTAAAGTYTLTYNVSDKAGNAATAVTRTVTVK